MLQYYCSIMKILFFCSAGCKRFKEAAIGEEEIKNRQQNITPATEIQYKSQFYFLEPSSRKCS